MRVLAIAVAVVLAGCECNRARGQLAVVFDDHGQLVTSTVEGDFPLGPVASGNRLSQPIVLKNVGSSPIVLTRAERVSGAQVAFNTEPQASEPWRLDGFSDGFELAPSTVKGLDLTLTAPPTSMAVLDESVTLRVHARNGEEDQTVLLVVRAEDFGGQCLADPVLDFGVIPVGTRRSRSIRLGNPTPETLVATFGDVAGAPELSGPAAGAVELAPSQVIERSYTFAPTAAGDFSAKVDVKPSAACPTVPVTLRGRAVDGWIVAQSPLNLGAQAIGATTHRGLIFSNWTMQPVTVSQLVLTLEQDFAVGAHELVLPPAQETPGMPLVPGTATLDVAFSPQRTGYRTANLAFATDLAAQPQGQAVLEGVGGAPDVEVSPAAIDFGEVPFFAGVARGPAAAAAISVHNRGDAPLHLGTTAFQLTANSLDGPATDVCVGDFDPQTGCLGTVSGYQAAEGIAPGATLLLPVHVVASQGSASGIPVSWTLALFTDDPDQPSSLVALSAEYVVAPPCQYTVTPLALDFGVVTSPAVGSLAVTITNVGANSSDRCIVTGLQLAAGTAPGFTLPLGAMNGVVLGAGQALTVPVQFTPQPIALLEHQTGALGFAISSPTQPFVAVPLGADEGDGCLVLSPPQHDFGNVALGCGAASSTFTASNVCDSPVTILSAAFATAGDFTVVAPIPPNTQLAAGASLTFALGYHGATFGPHQASFVVASDELGGTRTRTVTVTGNANLTGLEEDTRVQTAVGKADVLFLIDNSGSMQPLQSTLHDNLATFSQFLVDSGADVQLGVITTDLDNPDQSGRLQAAGTYPWLLDSLMPGFVSMAEQNLDVGYNGSGIEHLDAAILKALTPPLTNGRNAGLMRAGVPLAVIEISDAAGVYDNTFISSLRSAKSNGTVSYSAVKTYGGCGQGAAPTTPDDLYSSQTGGLELDLCQGGWGQSLEGVLKPVLELPATMPLVSVPDLSSGGSITVTVDGVALPQLTAQGTTTWSYDAATNAVTFNTLYVPLAGQRVTFTYPVACGP